MEDYIKKTTNIYSRAFSEHGKSNSSLLLPKGRQNERYSSLTANLGGTNKTVLDFGCGFGDLQKFLKERHLEIQYVGVDIVPEFINENLKSIPDNSEFKLISSHLDLSEQYDYVIVSGAFNTLYAPTPKKHSEIVNEIIRHLFSLARISISYDFMTTDVDFMQQGSYHQNPLEAYNFAKSLSSRLILNQSYMPYEFAITIFKDSEIIRPSNVYRELNEV
jgi:trans-aconitate methyltransferase